MAIDPVLTRGCVELVSAAELERKLARGKPLRVKLGVDPTSPDLHLGHTVVLQKLRHFQDQGHTAVLIIGDFTARIGDPSGRDATRPTLTREAIEANARTYKEQAFKVLREDRVELRYNSEWLEPFMETGLLPTLQRHTVQQLLAREDFANRMKSGSPVTLLEMTYPLMQGYDSVAVKADVELGGNDQLFNLLMGRRMQEDAGQEPQVALTLPLLVGLDGERKMSKSYGNAVALNDAPRDMFGKVMRVSDEAMWTYYELLTVRDLAAVKAKHPLEAKKDLAQELTTRYHGEAAGKAEREFFENTFSRRLAPADVATISLGASDFHKATLSQFLAVIVIEGKRILSRNEAFRLLGQGAVKRILDDGTEVVLHEGSFPEYLGSWRKEGTGAVTLKIGKHRFLKVPVSEG